MTTSSDLAIAAGTVIAGKWRKAVYRTVRTLGEGANGRVYLVSGAGGRKLFALKIGFDAADHQSEVNVIRALSRTSEHFRDFLVDVDDFRHEGRDYPFYVMRWIDGVQLAEFIRRKGRDWIGLTGLHLLHRLADLHKNDWIFGDLKLENIMVTGYGDIELVDFGGLTRPGRAIRQYTEIYDRGYWGAGMRTADEAYDLFAFSIVIMQLAGNLKECFAEGLLPQQRTLEALLEELERDPALHPYAPFLRKSLNGSFASTRAAYAEWKSSVYGDKSGRNSDRATGGSRPFLLKACFIASFVLFLTALFYVYR